MENKENKCPLKKSKALKHLRAALGAFLVFTLICGLLYTVSVTIFAGALFPHQANGSLIEVTLEDGSKRVYGSEFIGQSYLTLDSNKNYALVDENNNYYVTNSNGEYFMDENKNLALDSNEVTKLSSDSKPMVMFQAKYLIGRFNQGAPSNASPTTNSYKETIEARVKALKLIGYNDEYNERNGKNGIPDELVTESGSGLDPEISYDVAIYQAEMIASARGITRDRVIEIIDNHIKGRFLGIFGTKRVNVLMVNLELDGLI